MKKNISGIVGSMCVYTICTRGQTHSDIMTVNQVPKKYYSNQKITFQNLSIIPNVYFNI